MRARLGAMVVASDRAGNPVTADDLGVGGALTVGTAYHIMFSMYVGSCDACDAG